MTAVWIAAALAGAAVLLWTWPLRAAGRPEGKQQPVGGREALEACGGEVSVTAGLDLLAVALRGGGDIMTALAATAQALGGQRGAELRSVAAALTWGVDDDVAWATAPPSWAPASRALRLSRIAGAAPVDALTRAAKDERADQITAAEEKAARLGVWLVLPLGLLYLPAFILLTVIPVVLLIGGSILGGM